MTEAMESMANKISMALKDSVLQLGFEIFCKKIKKLEKENAELKALLLDEVIKGPLDKLTPHSIPLHIRVEDSNGKFDCAAAVKDVELYDLSDCGVANTVNHGLQITLRKIEIE